MQQHSTVFPHIAVWCFVFCVSTVEFFGAKGASRAMHLVMFTWILKCDTVTCLLDLCVSSLPMRRLLNFSHSSLKLWRLLKGSLFPENVFAQTVSLGQHHSRKMFHSFNVSLSFPCFKNIDLKSICPFIASGFWWEICEVFVRSKAECYFEPHGLENTSLNLQLKRHEFPCDPGWKMRKVVSPILRTPPKCSNSSARKFLQ